MENKQILETIKAHFSGSMPEMNSGAAICKVLSDIINYIDENNKPYEYIDKVNQYFFEIGYDGIDYDFAIDYFKNNNGVGFVGGCSSFRSGNWYGRNFDWLYNNNVDFLVRTKNSKGHYAVMGIAGNVSELNDLFVDSRKITDSYKILPFMLQDGVNEMGLFCNINVVPTDKPEGIKATKPLIERERICSTMLVRYILDNFDTADNAINYLRNYVSVYPSKKTFEMGYTTHLMIGDSSSTYVIEFVGDEIRVIESEIMTNFWLDGVTFNADGSVYGNADVLNGYIPTIENKLTPFSSGVERWNYINSRKPSINDITDVRDILNNILFSNAYIPTTNPYWFSEFVGNEFTIDTPTNHPDFLQRISKAQEYYEHRDRNNPIVWQTKHSVIYDLDKKKCFVVSQEDVSVEYEFNFSKYYTASEIDKKL